MKLPSIRSFNAFLSLTLELRTINLLIPRRLEYDFPVCSNYAGPRYYEFKQNLNNSVKLGAFSGLRHVVALSNPVNPF